MNAASGPSSPGQPSGQAPSGHPPSGSGPSSSGPTSSSPTSSSLAGSGLTSARRRIPRYPVAIPVDVTVLRSGLPSSIPGRSLDIGEGGVAAVLAAELQTGEWVAVELQLPNIGYALQTKAVVRHYNQLRCGFEFLGLSRDQRYMIRHWAGSSQPEPSSPEFPVISSALAKPPSPAASGFLAPLSVRFPGASENEASGAPTAVANVGVAGGGWHRVGLAMASWMATTGSPDGTKGRRTRGRRPRGFLPT